MDATGTITLDGQDIAVTGEAWFDHQWGDFISVGGGGWDWFAVNLDDGTDLTLSLVRDADGSYPLIYGTVVDPDGTTRHLDRDAFTVEVTDRWISPASGADYPAGWRIAIPAEGDLVIDLAPTVAAQELDTRATTGVVYWEGSQVVGGTRGGERIGGEAYVELTGYAPSGVAGVTRPRATTDELGRGHERRQVEIPARREGSRRGVDGVESGHDLEHLLRGGFVGSTARQRSRQALLCRGGDGGVERGQVLGHGGGAAPVPDGRGELRAEGGVRCHRSQDRRDDGGRRLRSGEGCRQAFGVGHDALVEPGRLAERGDGTARDAGVDGRRSDARHGREARGHDRRRLDDRDVGGARRGEGGDAHQRATDDHAAEQARTDEDHDPRRFHARDQAGVAAGTAGRPGTQRSVTRRAGEDVGVDLADREGRRRTFCAATADPPDLLCSDFDGHEIPAGDLA